MVWFYRMNTHWCEIEVGCRAKLPNGFGMSCHLVEVLVTCVWLTHLTTGILSRQSGRPQGLGCLSATDQASLSNGIHFAHVLAT